MAQVRNLALVLFALCLLAGCAKSDPKPTNPADLPVAMPQPVVETGDGPAEGDLAKGLDLPLYPGSHVIRNKTAAAGQEKRYHVTLETKDELSKIAAFYRAQGFNGSVASGKFQADGTTKNGNMVLVDAHGTEPGNEIMIMVIVAGK